MILTNLLRGVYFDRFLRDSEAYTTIEGIERTQRDVLARLIAAGRKTLWGEEHHLEKVDSYEDFAATQPGPLDYSVFRPYVMRMIDGERDILWPGVTRNFAQSSGTSDGKSKYIPVTAD